MKQSKLFSKTRKEAPVDEVSKNAQLLIRAGYVYKEMAEVYAYLPLGLRVLQKISNIVREEMNKTGGVELQAAALQKKEIWQKSNRWDDKIVDNWFKTKLKNNTELGLAFSHEEPITDMMTNFISSYKDLPVYVYDIRTIFRNEARAKSGIMRGREFFWKALYSFSKDEAEHNKYYEKDKVAYKNVFKRVGLDSKTYLTFALGGTFSKYSHEFQTMSDAGEDTIYTDKKKKIAVNKEVYNKETLKELGLKEKDLAKEKAIEVGNIFSLGYKFSKAFNLKYRDEKGKDQFVYMGCYGIGISRLMGAIVEEYNDDKGIVWQESVAPFLVHLISVGESAKVKQTSEKVYKDLSEKGVEILYDDRKDKSPGEKFAEADLTGIPWRVVISEKTLAKNSAELKERSKNKTELIKIKDLGKI
jgi:prolyl-tRNA synthetase